LKRKILVQILTALIILGTISGCVEKDEIMPINKPPTVNFNYDVQHNKLFDGGKVIFNSTAIDENNGDLTYFWDFGDKETSTIADPVHEYSRNGSYTVKLKVNDTKNETIKIVTILVGNIGPIAGFTWSAVNLTVTFTDASSDLNEDDLTYAWYFNEDFLVDNETAGPVVYSYPTAGAYNVSLTVKDPWGLVDTSKQMIVVKEEITN